MLLAAVLTLPMRPSSAALDLERLQQAAASMGPRTERAAADLRDLIQRVRADDEAQRLLTINNYVNRRVAFVTDQQAWGQVDYWATPLESLGRGQGDCEDYAIAKYFTLVAAGVPVQRLRLVYVRAQLTGRAAQIAGSPVQAHMVLAYYADNDGEPVILDNLVPDIRPASDRTDLTPVFSFNGDGLWNGTGPLAAGDPQARLSRWRDMLARARSEGFE